MTAGEPIVSITDLHKTYGSGKTRVAAVSGISLTIPRGAFFGLLGPNGAGKSTTIGCMTGTHTITAGSITIGGFDVVHEHRQARRQVGLSSQEYNVNPFESVYHLVDFMGGYYGVPARERRPHIESLFTTLDLHQHRNKQFRELSGGLKRRVVLARALVHNPPLLILDEPTAGIDVEQRRDIWRLLTELNNQGVTIIMTSHYLEEMERLCDRIAIIDQGRIVADRAQTEYHSQGRTLEEEYLAITASVRNGQSVQENI